MEMNEDNLRLFLVSIFLLWLYIETRLLGFLVILSAFFCIIVADIAGTIPTEWIGLLTFPLLGGAYLVFSREAEEMDDRGENILSRVISLRTHLVALLLVLIFIVIKTLYLEG